MEKFWDWMIENNYGIIDDIESEQPIGNWEYIYDLNSLDVIVPKNQALIGYYIEYLYKEYDIKLDDIDLTGASSDEYLTYIERKLILKIKELER